VSQPFCCSIFQAELPQQKRTGALFPIKQCATGDRRIGSVESLRINALVKKQKNGKRLFSCLSVDLLDFNPKIRSNEIPVLVLHFIPH